MNKGNDKPSWNGKQALLPLDRAEIFFDGTFTEPRLNHPEGLAFDAEGNLWCGGECGEIYRICKSAESIEIECAASTGGFTLGMAFDDRGRLYACDLKWSAVFRFDPKTGTLDKFADGDAGGNKLKIPNVPVIHSSAGWIYISDSHHPQQEGPGIWRFDLETGEGSIWYGEPLRFANGMAMPKNGDAIWVAETFAKRISRIPILHDGSPGKKETVVHVPALPDGLTFDSLGRLYISCYEPSLIFRWSETGGLELLYYDTEAHTLCHPTNCAFKDGDLYTSNLGRWHITRIREVESLS